MNRIGLRCLKVGYVPGKSLEPERIKEVEVYRKDKLEPLLEQAINGEKVVFFVDAAHFVHKAYLGFLWCFARTFICSPSGRRRFNVLGAINAVTKEIITVTNETYINAESICELLTKMSVCIQNIMRTLLILKQRFLPVSAPLIWNGKKSYTAC